VRLDSPLLAEIVDRYRVSRVVNSPLPVAQAVYDLATSDELSPGEKVLTAAGAGLSAAAEGAEVVTRPLRAARDAFTRR
jgi:hypothetical protein